jgi:hypothetical protein
MCRNGKRSSAAGLEFWKEISELERPRLYGILGVRGTHAKVATLLLLNREKV